MTTWTLQPGTLIALSTRVAGGVTYHREDIDHEMEGSTERTKWDTERIIDDVEEHAKAIKVRSKVRSLILQPCIQTPIGTICINENLEALDKGVADARDLIEEFNATAVHSKVRFALLRGTIAENAADAIAAVRLEIADLLDQLDKATRQGSVKTIRDVAAQCTQLDRLLEQETDASAKFKSAINAARTAATTIKKRVDGQNEELDAVLAEVSMNAIAIARFAFAEGDDEMDEILTDTLPATPLSRFAAMEAEEEEGQL